MRYHPLHPYSLALIVMSVAIWSLPTVSLADSWGRSSSGSERLRGAGILGQTDFGRPSPMEQRYHYEPGDYMIVEDDAELGEVILVDTIARVSDMDIRELWDIHDIWDLYPEEVATVLFLREMTGSSYAIIASLRADDGLAWKEIAYEYRLEPRVLGESPNWYQRDRIEDWWREDPDIEHRIMLAMLATEFMVDERDLDRLSRDGLGYSDMATMLELSARSGIDYRDLLELKMERRLRWRTIAENYRMDLRDLDAKRAYHWHNADFRGYYHGDDREYHANRGSRQHRTRREYHYYDVWVPEPDTGYYHFDYVVDYDYYFPYGRTYYSYWWPTDCWWDRVHWGYYWDDPIYHRPYAYDVQWVPRDPYYDDWRADPWIVADPPRERDGRRYAERIIERYGDSRSTAGDWNTQVRVSNGGVVTVTRGERGDPGAPARASSSGDHRGSSARSGDARGSAPPPRTSPPRRSNRPPEARGSSNSGRSDPPRSDRGRSSNSGSNKGNRSRSRSRDDSPPPARSSSSGGSSAQSGGGGGGSSGGGGGSSRGGGGGSRKARR